MNTKQIEILEDQASLYASRQTTDPDEWEFIFRKKFAELIVKECVEQLVKEGDAWEQFSRNPPEGQETNAGHALFAAYRLKEDAVSRLEEHFGVEE